MAGIPSASGRTANYGGTLVLTTHRLIWEALRLPPGLDQLAGGRFLQRMTRGVPLAEITGVRADQERKAMLHVESTDGDMRLLISASRLSPIWSKKNHDARDAAVARLGAAFGG